MNKLSKQLMNIAKNLYAIQQQRPQQFPQLPRENFTRENDDTQQQVYNNDIDNVNNDKKYQYNYNVKYQQKDSDKKYILYKKQDGNLWRIKACKKFSDVNVGDLGGLIQSQYNLSQKGDCWVYDNSKVSEESVIKDDVTVSKNSIVKNAKISGKVKIINSTINPTNFINISGEMNSIIMNIQIY